MHIYAKAACNMHIYWAKISFKHACMYKRKACCKYSYCQNMWREKKDRTGACRHVVLVRGLHMTRWARKYIRANQKCLLGLFASPIYFRWWIWNLSRGRHSVEEVVINYIIITMRIHNTLFVFGSHVSFFRLIVLAIWSNYDCMPSLLEVWTMHA